MSARAFRGRKMTRRQLARMIRELRGLAARCDKYPGDYVPTHWAVVLRAAATDMAQGRALR